METLNIYFVIRVPGTFERLAKGDPNQKRLGTTALLSFYLDPLTQCRIAYNTARWFNFLVFGFSFTVSISRLYITHV